MLKSCILLLLTCLPGLAAAQTDLYLVKTGQLPYAGRTQSSVNVVVESPVSEARMHDMFEAMNVVLRTHPEVGAYNQTI